MDSKTVWRASYNALPQVCQSACQVKSGKKSKGLVHKSMTSKRDYIIKLLRRHCIRYCVFPMLDQIISAVSLQFADILRNF